MRIPFLWESWENHECVRQNQEQVEETWKVLDSLWFQFYSLLSLIMINPQNFVLTLQIVKEKLLAAFIKLLWENVIWIHGKDIWRGTLNFVTFYNLKREPIFNCSNNVNTSYSFCFKFNITIKYVWSALIFNYLLFLHFLVYCYINSLQIFLIHFYFYIENWTLRRVS